MSHVATGIVQRRKTGGASTKSVLMFMAGCASDDGTGIWTSKKNMADDLEISKRTVQRATDDLLAAGLIAEVGQRRCRNGFTIEYRINLNAIELLPSTRDKVTPVDTTSRGDTMSPVPPSHLTGDTMSPQEVTPCHPNLPRIIHEPCGPGADPQTNDVPSEFLKEFAAAFPRIGNLEKTEAALRQAIADGAKPEVILAGAKAYAVEQEGNQTRYIAYSENWVAQARWVQFEQPAADPADAEKITERWVKAIKSGHQALARHCSVATARELIARMLVTEDECRAAGILL